MVKPVFDERPLHAKAFYLQDAGYHDAAPNLADKERQAMIQALADVSAGIRQLTTLARLQRLDNEELVHTAEFAVNSGDVGLAGICLEEATGRKDGLLKLQVSKLVDTIKIPEAEVAEQFFTLAEDVLQEIADIEQHMERPSDLTRAALRSREIRHENEDKAREEQAAKAKAERERQEQERKEQQTAIKGHLQETPQAAA